MTTKELTAELREAKRRNPAAYLILSLVAPIPEARIRDIAEEKVSPTAAEKMMLEAAR